MLGLLGLPACRLDLIGPRPCEDEGQALPGTFLLSLGHVIGLASPVHVLGGDEVLLEELLVALVLAPRHYSCRLGARHRRARVLDLLRSRPFLKIPQGGLGGAQGRSLSLDISGQLRTVEPDQELAPLDHVSLPDQPFDNTPGDLDAHVHLGRLDGARHRDGSCRQMHAASTWFLARSSSSSGTGSLLTRSISSMIPCSSASGVWPGSGVPENQKRFGSRER